MELSKIAKKFGDKFYQLTSSKNKLFYFGLVLIILPTVVKIIGERHSVFLIYRFGCLDFWNDVNPYSNWVHDGDKYLYGPVFSIFFSIFAFLPTWLGGFLWNLFNYSMLFLSVFNLPSGNYPFEKKRFLLLFMLPILLTELFYFQFNVGVTYLFLFAFGYFEKGKPLKAIAIVLFSGFSKIYGLVQLSFLIFYRRFLPNALFAIVLAAALFFIPLIKIPFTDLIDYYLSWFAALSRRHDPTKFETVFNLFSFFGFSRISDFIFVIQIVTMAILAILTILNWYRFKESSFRAEFLGILMTWIILFSTAAEAHTYIIAIAGYLIWYFQQKNTLLDRILLWSIFVVITLIPIDVIFPVAVMNFVFGKLHLNIILFLFTWLRMCTLTYGKTNIKQSLDVKSMFSKKQV